MEPGLHVPVFWMRLLPISSMQKSILWSVMCLHVPLACLQPHFPVLCLCFPTFLFSGGRDRRLIETLVSLPD
jgi:hypothetical protein